MSGEAYSGVNLSERLNVRALAVIIAPVCRRYYTGFLLGLVALTGIAGRATF
jgi:hypothetical protein